MINWLTRRARREAAQQLVVELFHYNKRDACWDPVGSIDRAGMERTIKAIAIDQLSKHSVEQARHLFSKRKR